MSEAFIGEIRAFAGNYAPAGWALCNGQLESIAQNQALFTLLGTTYGGDGQTTFALPDLRGRLPVGQGQGPGLSPYTIGQRAGTESVTLLQNQLPAHNHLVQASTATGNVSAPGPSVVPAAPDAPSQTETFYAVPGTSAVNPVTMLAAAIGPTGNGLPHENRMPTLTVSFIIALNGIFPSRN